MTIKTPTPSDQNPVDPLAQTVPGKPSGYEFGKDYAIFHSGQAVELFNGRPPGRGGKPPILGVKDFDRITDGIYRAATLDDPYADWFLLRIKETISVVEEDLQIFKTRFETLLRTSRNVMCQPAAKKPGAIEIKFHGPYSWPVLNLVQTYDDILRLGFKVRQTHMIPPTEVHEIWKVCENKIRSMMYEGTRWRNFHIARADVRQNTQRAQEARARMGDLPQDVLDGTWTALDASVKKKIPVQRADELAQVAEKAKPAAPKAVAIDSAATGTSNRENVAGEPDFFTVNAALRQQRGRSGAGASVVKRTRAERG